MPFWKRKSITPNAAASSSQSQWQTTIPNRGNPSQPPAPPPTTNAFYQRGNEFFNASDYKNAVFMYREALRQPMDLATQTSAYLQLAMSQTMVNPPELADALNSINKAVQLNPSNGSIWRVKADIHEGLGDYGSAKDALSNASGLVMGYEKIQVSQALARMESLTASGFTSARPPNVQSPQATPASPNPVPLISSPSISISQPSQPPASPSSPRRNVSGTSASSSSPFFAASAPSAAAGSSCKRRIPIADTCNDLPS